MYKNTANWIILVLSFVSATVSAQHKIYETSNGQFEIKVPQDWQDLALHDDAEIQIGNGAEEQYLILLSDKKTDMYGWNIHKHSYITLGGLLQSLNSPTVSGPDELEINGNKGLRFVIEGATQGLEIVYVHTTIETTASFNQILAWTVGSKYESNKAILEAVVDSFREK